MARAPESAQTVRVRWPGWGRAPTSGFLTATGPTPDARLLAEEGIAPWAGINCRDRNRVAIEGEIAACVDAGVVGLHCVTGDHPSTGHRPDARPVFDLDCVEVIELARPSGALCSTAHAPSAAPTERRLARLLAKIGG